MNNVIGYTVIEGGEWLVTNLLTSNQIKDIMSAGHFKGCPIAAIRRDNICYDIVLAHKYPDSSPWRYVPPMY